MNDTDQYIHPNLIDAFGGLERYLGLPILELPPIKSDYLDYIRPTDMKYPITRGVDFFKRNFVAFRLIFNGTHTNRVEKLTCVIFQRYINETFCASASFPAGDHDTFLYGTRQESCDRIKLLLSEGEVTNTDRGLGKIGTYTLF